MHFSLEKSSSCSLLTSVKQHKGKIISHTVALEEEVESDEQSCQKMKNIQISLKCLTWEEKVAGSYMAAKEQHCTKGWGKQSVWLYPVDI